MDEGFFMDSLCQITLANNKSLLKVKIRQAGETYPIGDQAREQKSRQKAGGHNMQNSGRRRKWLEH